MTLKPEIRQSDLSDEFWTDEQCHILELSNTENDNELSIARARVAVGVTTRWHKLHQITERYVILEGEGVVEVGDLEPQVVTTGSVVIIPPDVRQRIRNSGSSELVFLAICTPRFRVECYQDMPDVSEE